MTYKIGPKGQSLTDNPTSLTYGKYDDRRMAWVGRYPGLRVVPVLITSTLICEQNENRVYIALTNDGTDVIYLNLGEDAILNSTLRLAPTQSIVFDRNMPWPDRIYGIVQTTTSNLLVCDVSQVVIDGRGE